MSGILALDLARTLGWAHATDQAVADWPGDPWSARSHDWSGLTYGSARLGPPGSVTTGELVNLAQRWFRAALRCEPGIVVVERPLPTNMGHLAATQEQLQAHAYAIEAEVRKAGLLWAALPLNSIRKHFCGNGNAKKPDVAYVCRQRGWQPQDHNQSDALALLDFHIASTRAALRGVA